MRTPAYLATLILIPWLAHADAVEDALNAALKAHREKKPAEALASLQTAAKLLTPTIDSPVERALPKQIGPWVRSRVEAKSLEGGVGGSAVTCSYKQGDKDKGTEKRINVNIAADAPMMAKLATFLKAPELGKLFGAQAKTVSGQSAMYLPKEGILQFAVDARYVVVVQGKKMSGADLTEIANAISIDVLKSLPK
jgi:hypothetical protein